MLLFKAERAAVYNCAMIQVTLAASSHLTCLDGLTHATESTGEDDVTEQVLEKG